MPISKINDFFDIFCISNAKIGIAVSGGSDSIFLLHSLNAIKTKFNIQLHILHVNYHLRGDNSNKDANFIENIALQLQIPFFKLDSPIDPQSSSIEAKARDIRYSYFEKIRSEHQLQYIAIGHTSEDQVETILFRLIRGSSLYGLSGMEEVRDDGIIRPMLHCSKEECNNWLNTNHLSWREDLSNKETIYTRNLIRHEMIPLIKQINSGATSHILSFSKQCRESYKELLNQGQNFLLDLNIYEDTYLFHLKKWDSLTESLKVAIADLLRKRNCPLSDHHLATIANAGQSRGKETLLPNGWRIYSSYNRIIFYHKSILPFSKNIFHNVDNGVNTTQNGLYQVPNNLEDESNSIMHLNEIDEKHSSKHKKRLKKIGVPSKERELFPVILVDGEYILLKFN